MRLEKKLEKFAELCGDWDFRNIDMTTPHLESIDIDTKNNKIKCECERYSTEMEEYYLCNGGTFIDKELVSQFKKMDLDDKNLVNEFICDIELHLNWDLINEKLDEENVISIVEEIKNNLKNIDNNEICEYEVNSYIELYPNILKKINEKDRTKALIMLYKVNPTLEQLNNWNNDDIMNYIVDTDDSFEENKEIYKECFSLIEQSKEL